MPADTSIYSLLKPIEPVRSDPDLVQKMGNAFQQGSQMAAGMEAKANKARMQEAYGRNMGDDGKMNRAGYMNDLARIDPEKAMQMQKHYGELDAAAAEAKYKALENQANQTGYVANLAMGAKDQASYDAMKAQLANDGYGEAAGRLPKQYDPGMIRNYATTYLKSSERLNAQLNEMNRVRDEQKLDFEKTKEKNDIGFKYSELGQKRDIKQAELTGNALLADKRGQQDLASIRAKAEEERRTNGIVTADTQAKLDAQLKGNAKGGKAKPLVADQANRIAGYESSLSMIGDLRGAIDANKENFGPFSGRLASANPYDTRGQSVSALFKKATQTIGTALERGKLTDKDFPKYQKMLPTQSDTPEVAYAKLDQLERMVQEQRKADIDTYGQSGSDVSQFEKIDPREIGITKPENKAGQKVGGGLIKEAKAGKSWDSPETNPKYFEALKFIKANPTDPRAKAMLEKIKGGQ